MKREANCSKDSNEISPTDNEIGTVNEIMSHKPDIFERIDGRNNNTPPGDWKWRLRPVCNRSTEIGKA